MLSTLEKHFIKFQFNSKARTRVYRKLNRFLGNSVPLRDALDIIYAHASDDGRKPKHPVAMVIDEWRKQVRNGKTFGKAIQGWVPESDRLVIEGGEAAGNLAVAIDRAVMISGASKKIQTTLITGLAYPFLLLVAAIGFMIMFGTNVVPSFEEVMPRDQWTGIGAQMAVMSDFVDNYLSITVGVILGVWALIIVTLPRWTGNLRTKFDKYPPWSLYRLILGSGFMLTVSGMIKAGIPIPRILQMLQRGASPWYAEKLSRTLFYVNNGQNLGEALHLTGFNFPDKDTVQDLRAYASLNKFDETLEKLGEEWLEDSVQKVEQQTGIVRNLSFVVFGFVFGWIAMGIMDLVQQVGNSTM